MNELLHLLGDPAHWGFEFITDLVFGAITFAWGRGWLRRHDRQVHSIGLDSESAEWEAAKR